jgi:hypothetical protein
MLTPVSIAVSFSENQLQEEIDFLDLSDGEFFFTRLVALA